MGGCGRYVVRKFDGGMNIVEGIDEFSKFVLSMCPNQKISSIQRSQNSSLSGAVSRA